MCVYCQLIGHEMTHAYACVCVLAADWREGGSCICMCVCCGQLIGEKVAHAYACVCCEQLIGEKVAHAYACVRVVGS